MFFAGKNGNAQRVNRLSNKDEQQIKSFIFKQLNYSSRRATSSWFHPQRQSARQNFFQKLLLNTTTRR